MQLRYVTFAVVAALATMGVFAPTVGALDGKPIIPDYVCRAQVANEQNVFAAAAAEAHVNWQPDCVDVFSGGKVLWSMADLAHLPVANGCFKAFSLNNGAQTKSTTFTYNPEDNTVTVNAPLGNGALRQTTKCVPGTGAQEREGPIVGIAGSSGPKLPTVVDIGDAIEIHYICDLHKAKMHARIIVEKTAA